MSYRACFKPQLPEFFISRLTVPGEVVYDPFMGRGTTMIQAALMGRIPYGCDINPLSTALCEPRLTPPSIRDVERALGGVDFSDAGELPEELLVFYHPDTLRQICALRKYLASREEGGRLTAADRWIQMVALNRLTGQTPGRLAGLRRQDPGLRSGARCGAAATLPSRSVKFAAGLCGSKNS